MGPAFASDSDSGAPDGGHEASQQCGAARPPRPSGDPENLRRVLSWSALCRRLSGVTRRPGVTRYRSIEEADAARTAEEHADSQG